MFGFFSYKIQMMLDLINWCVPIVIHLSALKLIQGIMILVKVYTRGQTNTVINPKNKKETKWSYFRKIALIS